MRPTIAPWAAGTAAVEATAGSAIRTEPAHTGLDSIRFARVQSRAVGLHVACLGEGEPVLLLHGFPELWWAWRRQLPALAAAGLCAVAPDLRGYGESDRPPRVDAYRADELIADVLALVAWTGRDRVRLVGHDWGATIAWMFAARHPERVERLAILNGAHPRLLLRELEKPDQRRRSAYFAFFQLPCLPEWWVTRRAYLERVLRGKAVSADAFGDADIERYHDALRRPGAAKAAIDYYRAARRWPLDAGAVRCPTLVVWGERDHALGPGLLDGLQQVAPDPRIVRIAGASHWVQHDAPETGEPRADRAPPAVSHRA